MSSGWKRSGDHRNPRRFGVEIFLSYCLAQSTIPGVDSQFSDTSVLQYQRDLLINNPHSPCDLVESYSRCTNVNGPTLGGQRRRFTNYPRNYPLNNTSPRLSAGAALLSITRKTRVSVSFASHRSWVPSQSSGGTSPPFSFNLGAFATYPPDNLLAVAEEKER